MIDNVLPLAQANADVCSLTTEYSMHIHAVDGHTCVCGEAAIRCYRHCQNTMLVVAVAHASAG